jgi:hypothetical protein
MHNQQFEIQSWEEWDGNDYIPNSSNCLVFYSFGHYSFELDEITSSLSKYLAEEGVFDSRFEAKRSLSIATARTGYVGRVDDDYELTVCDDYGTTRYGDYVDAVRPITWVEVDDAR